MNILFDCDGTLAEFRTNGQYRVPGYFLSLGPHDTMIGALEKLFSTPDVDVRIITSIPAGHPTAKEEKLQWFHRWLPFVPDEKIIFSKCGQGKELFVDNAEQCMLIDDFGENIKTGPGKYVKVSRDSEDMKGELLKHAYCVNHEMSAEEIALTILFACYGNAQVTQVNG